MPLRIIAMTSLVLMVASLNGCKGCDDEISPTTGEKLVNLEMKRGRLFVLELQDVEVEKVVGGKEAEREFRHFVNHNQLLLYTHPKSKHIYRLGVTAPAASYGESSYERVRGRSDHMYIRIPSNHIRLVKDDGTEVNLDITSMRISPRQGDETDLIDSEFIARVQGAFSILHGDTRFSGDFSGTWRGHPDETAPEVTIVAPAKGLVSGSFDIYFDEPVTAEDIQQRVILRDKAGKALNITVRIFETNIPGYTTHLRVQTGNLLPFNERLTLAVGTGFEDLVGNKVARPTVKVVNTPDYPPLMNPAGHDFSEDTDGPEFLTQGYLEIVDEYLGIKPYSGRLLKLLPPRSGSRHSSALVSRLRVGSDAKWLQVRVIKVARTRDTPTPCLRYVVASITGVLHNIECGPTDVPRSKIDTDSGEQFTTPWIHLNIDVSGHRGHEVILVVEAPPLAPDVAVDMEPVFLVDMIRTVWEGQDPKVIQGDFERR